MHGQLALRGRQENHTADFGEPQGRLHVEGGKNRLESDMRRRKFIDQLGDLSVDLMETSGQIARRITRGGNHPKRNRGAMVSNGFDDGIAGGAGGSRIHSKNSKSRGKRGYFGHRRKCKA